MAEYYIQNKTEELNKRIDDVLMEFDIQNNKTKKKIQQLEDEVHNLRIILGLLSIVAVGIWTIQWIL